MKGIALKVDPENARKTVNVRLEREAYEWLRRRAFENYKSMNSELNQLIIDSIASEKAAVEGASQGQPSTAESKTAL